MSINARSNTLIREATNRKAQASEAKTSDPNAVNSGAHQDTQLDTPNLYLVCPCYNEEHALPHFLLSLYQILPLEAQANGYIDTRIILVDDGSFDATGKVIEKSVKREAGLSVVGLKLSRNFGHQAAIQAGLEYIYSRYLINDHDTIVIMDSDGQHPPELIKKLLNARAENIHHVQMLRTNSGAGFFKGITSRSFYWLFRKFSGIPLYSGSSDFRALSGQVAREYLKLSESGRFNRGLFYWLGFSTKSIPYIAPERSHGESKYSVVRMISLALRGLTYFSSRPLVFTLAGITGLGFFACSIYVAIEFVRLLHGVTYVAGWPTVIFAIIFWGSLLSLGQLLTALYVARVFDEVKRRPLYLVEKSFEPIADSSKDAQ